MEFRFGQNSEKAEPDPSTVDVISRFYPKTMDEYLNPPKVGDAVSERAENARWERLLEIAKSSDDTRPVLTSEYAHCMGNALGNLKEYWDEIYSNPRMLGGFIWDWVDQGYRRRAANGKSYFAYGGDFGDQPNSGAFCLNGVIFADRTYSAKYNQVKKIYQPFKVLGLYLKPGNVQIQMVNRNNFLDISEFECRWSVITNGKIFQSGITPELSIPAGETGIVSIPIKIFKPEAGAEYYLMVSLHLKKASNWANAGFELGFEQLKLDIQTPPLVLTNHSKDPAINFLSERDSLVKVTGKNFVVKFSKNKGGLNSWKINGGEMLVEGPIFQAYRAYTDNDKGFGNWLAKDWKNAGLENLKREVKSFNITGSSKNSLTLEVEVKCLAKTGYFIQKSIYTVYGDGSMDVKNKFEPFGDLPYLPRMGLSMQLSKQLESFVWYGHGPYENYADRKDCTPTGLWNSTVTEQYVPYPRPQECGNKEGVRWLSLTDAKGKGLKVISEDIMSVSALHYSVEDLDKASNTWELNPREAVVLSLDAFQMGLGNSSCGPGVLKKYSPEKRAYDLNFILMPL